MKLFLVRHTAVKVAPGLCYGRSEVPLASTFEAEAEAVLERFADLRCVVYTSPAARCRRLAEKLSPAPIVDRRLCELDFGLWEGRSWDDLPSEVVRRWCDDFVAMRTPGGESFAELAARVGSFSEEVSWASKSSAAIVVTHAGVIRALLSQTRGLPLADAFSISVSFGAVFEIETKVSPCRVSPGSPGNAIGTVASSRIPHPLDDFASVPAQPGRKNPPQPFFS